MLTRRRALLLAPAALLATAMAGTAAFLSLRRPAAAQIGGPFTLVNGDGRTVTDRSFAGKWMLVYFGYTHCPDACPTALSDMANAVDTLGPGKDKVAIVFITVDPERDTPAVVKDYVANFEAPIAALTGTPEQVAAAARAYRVYYAKHQEKDGAYEMDHSSIIYLMDPDGRFDSIFTHDTAVKDMAAKLKALV